MSTILNTIPEQTGAPERTPNDDIACTVDRNIGGQAVIEGVMMRSETTVATAVRLPDGTIELASRPYRALVKRHRFLNVPIARGAISFVEMLVLGLETLNWSADAQLQYEDRQNGTERDGDGKNIWNTIALWGSMAFAFVLALGLFFALPIWIATALGFAKGAMVFNLVAGTVRLLLFLGYVSLISLFPDIKRVFRYHGAEHMSIFALEADAPLSLDTVRGRSRRHPRCGTSFIMIVVLIGILMFAIADSLFPMIFGHMQNYLERLATHLLLLPLVAGGSYELLKLSGKFRNNRVVRLLTAPGLLIQHITTAEPDDDMLEVAICALRAALSEEDASVG